MSSYQSLKAWRARLKIRLHRGFGSVCGICGFDRPQALDFHHLNPHEKEFTIASWRKGGWDKISKEVSKCVLLCSNCHRCVHANVLDIPETIRRFDEHLARDHEEPRIRVFVSCPVCGKQMLEIRKTCSNSCRAKMIAVTDWSSPVILEILTKYGTYQKAAKAMGVSGTSFAKQVSKHHPHYKHPHAHGR